jgi:hypothetical protein
VDDTSKTDDKVTITAIKDFGFKFLLGEGDDALISHEAKTLPKLPFTFQKKGSMLNFKTQYSSRPSLRDPAPERQQFRNAGGGP